MPAKLTKHSKMRSKTRLNVSSNRAKSEAQFAYKRGIRLHEAYDPKLKYFMNTKYYSHSDKCNMIVYNGNLYFFKQNIVITVYPLPEELKPIAQKIQREKKEGILETILTQRKERIICEACNSRMKFINVDYYECMICGNTYNKNEKKGKTMDLENLKLNAKNEIINLLGENVNNPRVIQELELLNNKNFIEILLAKKVTDFLKNNNQYYVVRALMSNLYINYLLGITSVNPCDENNYLPYEFLFEKGNANLVYDILVSDEVQPMVMDYIKDLFPKGETSSEYFREINGDLKKLDYKFSIALDDSINLKETSRIFGDDKVITINILPSSIPTKLNYFIKNYGMPTSDYYKEKVLTDEVFINHNLLGIVPEKEYIKYLSLVSDDCYEFNTYSYISSGIHSSNVLNQFENEKIDKDRIHYYPTTREKIYSLCIEYGIDKNVALEICRYTRMGIGYRVKHKERWIALYNMLPEPFANYLDNIEYVFPLGHVLELSKMEYLMLYYKLNAPDFYEIMLGDSFDNYSSISEEALNLLLHEAELNNNEYDILKIKLFKEYLAINK